VSSACLEANNSIGGANFDPFAKDWIAAMMGTAPNGGALAFNPDTNGNGRVSAQEAHDYADAVHDPYDTPVYNESSAAAGETHLGQRYVWWWWYWCIDLRKLLEVYYVKLPPTEFYDRWHTKFVPRLGEYEDALDKAIRTKQRELDPQLKKLVEQAFE
jgi:hypothetical protein